MSQLTDLFGDITLNDKEREKQMGAHNFLTFGCGDTAKEAFDKLVEEAVYEYGHSPYNGTISTTRLNNRHHTFLADKFDKSLVEEAYKIASDDGWGEKWESRVINCGEYKDSHMWAFYGWASE